MGGRHSSSQREDGGKNSRQIQEISVEEGRVTDTSKRLQRSTSDVTQTSLKAAQSSQIFVSTKKFLKYVANLGSSSPNILIEDVVESPDPPEQYETISTVPFFEDLTKAKLKKLGSLFSRRVFSSGDVIFEEGKDSEEFYVIVNGTVRLTAKKTESVDVVDSEESIFLDDVKMGSCFGTSVLLSSESRQAPASAIALESPTTTYSISTELFSKFKEEYELFPSLKLGSKKSSACDTENKLGRDDPIHVLVRLQELPFFAHLDDYLLRQLGILFEFRRYRQGQVIIRQGDKFEGFSVLVKGLIEISASSRNTTGSKHLGTMRVRDIFGEISLVQQSTSFTTLTARIDTVVLLLSRDKFNRFLHLAPDVIDTERFKQMICKRTSDALKMIPIFEGLLKKKIGPLEQYNEESLQLLANLFTFTEFESGDRIYCQGDLVDSFYIILQGSVKVASEGPVEKKEEIFFEKLSEGECFGENALLTENDGTVLHCTESVTAISKVALLKLRSASINQFKEIAPDAFKHIEYVLSMKTAKKLESFPFFANVKENRPWSKMGLLGTLFKFESFVEDTVIIREGHAGDKFFIIVEGEVQISVLAEDGQSNIIIDKLTSGQWFGEISLILDTPRTATVTTVTPTLVLSLSRDSFKRFLNIAPELAEPFEALVTHRTANTLRKFSFFANIKENRPWSKLELLASLMQYELYPDPVILFRVGNAGEKFYIIARGSVEVLLESSNDSAEKIIERLTEGSYFGEMALLNQTSRAATVRTSSKNTVLLSLTMECFRKFLQITPELKVLLEQMAQSRNHALSTIN